jgi:hypothetical protein
MITDNDVKILRQISNAVAGESGAISARWSERAERVIAMLREELPELSDEILAFIAQIVSSAAASVANTSVTDAGRSLDLIFTSYSLAAAKLLKIDTAPVTAAPDETKPSKPENIGFYL